MMKRSIFLFVILLALYGCFDPCAGEMSGQSNNYYNTQKYEMYLKDTSNKFTGYWTSFLNIKYEFSPSSYNYRNNLIWDVGIQEKSMIVLWHKKGIDTIICDLKRQKLEYVKKECDGYKVNLNISEPVISYHSFDTIYFYNNFLILE